MDSKSIFSFLQPSLLSREQIIEILVERCISKELLIDKGKDELVEIFERVAKPLTCRGSKRKSKQSGVSVSLTEKRVVKSVTELSSDVNTGQIDSHTDAPKKSTIISLTKRIKREPEKSPVPSKIAKMEQDEDTKLKEETPSTKKKKWTKIVW